MTKFIVDGQERELRYMVNGIDISGDMIGNTYHGMDSDDEGRYIAAQEDFEWWSTYFVNHETMEGEIARYKEAGFDADQVDQIVQEAMSGRDYGDQPHYVISELKEVFGEAS
jgi:hypothetical protein